MGSAVPQTSVGVRVYDFRKLKLLHELKCNNAKQ
jgi:hypothetical protein